MPEQKEEEPPWVVYPEHELGEGFFKQGEGNTFMPTLGNLTGLP